MNAFVCLLLNRVDLCRISLYWKSDTFQLAMTSGEPWLCIKKSCIHWFLLVVFSFAKSCIHFISSHVHCLHYMTVNVLTRIFLLKNTHFFLCIMMSVSLSVIIIYLLQRLHICMKVILPQFFIWFFCAGMLCSL